MKEERDVREEKIISVRLLINIDDGLWFYGLSMVILVYIWIYKMNISFIKYFDCADWNIKYIQAFDVSKRRCVICIFIFCIHISLLCIVRMSVCKYWEFLNEW